MTNFYDLSPKQLKLLKQIAKSSEDNPMIRTEKYNNDDIEYLKSLKYVKVVLCDKDGDYYYQPKIKEHGKAYLYAKKKDTLSRLGSLTLFAFPFLLSILNAFTPFPIWCQEFLKNLFR